jgi:hypothetical protein
MFLKFIIYLVAKTRKTKALKQLGVKAVQTGFAKRRAEKPSSRFNCPKILRSTIYVVFKFTLQFVFPENKGTYPRFCGSTDMQSPSIIC